MTSFPYPSCRSPPHTPSPKHSLLPNILHSNRKCGLLFTLCILHLGLHRASALRGIMRSRSTEWHRLHIVLVDAEGDTSGNCVQGCVCLVSNSRCVVPSSSSCFLYLLLFCLYPSASCLLLAQAVSFIALGGKMSCFTIYQTISSAQNRLRNNPVYCKSQPRTWASVRKTLPTALTASVMFLRSPRVYAGSRLALWSAVF